MTAKQPDIQALEPSLAVRMLSPLDGRSAVTKP
jgi:hypothetical protein